jgi:hypothetical protein
LCIMFRNISLQIINSDNGKAVKTVVRSMCSLLSRTMD